MVLILLGFLGADGDDDSDPWYYLEHVTMSTDVSFALRLKVRYLANAIFSQRTCMHAFHAVLCLRCVC